MQPPFEVADRRPLIIRRSGTEMIVEKPTSRGRVELKRFDC